MKRLLLLMILGFAGSQVGLAQQVGPDQGAPPTTLEQRDGHWTANAAPPADTSEFQVHAVVAGDTLWAIANAYMDDPFLWPQVWEANAHIINPHWIYPEDIVLIRPVTDISRVIPPLPPAVPEVEPRVPRTPQIPTLTRPEEFAVPPVLSLFETPDARPVSPVKSSDLYCSGFVTTREIGGSGSSIIALTPPGDGLMASEGDYIYISRGSANGVSAGDILTAIRPTRNIESTRDGVGGLGRHYLELGQIQAVMVQPAFSLARVVHSCAEITLEDVVTPFSKIDFPELPSNRPFSTFMPSSGDVSGAVAMTLGPLRTAYTPNLGGLSIIAGARKGFREDGALPGVIGGIAGNGRIVYLDLGVGDGVQVGDLFIIYRELDTGRDRLRTFTSEAQDLLAGERYAVGELVVLKVEERAATAMITFSSDGVSPGDLVERR